MITTAQIEALRDEAGQAGDMMQARVADLALGFTHEDIADLAEATLTPAEAARLAQMDQGAALAECERVIAGAAAQ